MGYFAFLGKAGLICARNSNNAVEILGCLSEQPGSRIKIIIIMTFPFPLKIKGIVDPFMLTDAQESRVMDVLQSEMWLGMSRDPERRKLTSLQMENTYVRELLNGRGM